MGVNCSRNNRHNNNRQDALTVPVPSLVPYYPHKTINSKFFLPKREPVISYTDWFAKNVNVNVSITNKNSTHLFKHRLSSCPNSEVFQIIDIPFTVEIEEAKVVPKLKNKFDSSKKYLKIETPMDYYYLMGNETIKTLGEGSFGAVMLARKTNLLSKPGGGETTTVQDSACKLIKTPDSSYEHTALRTELYILQSIRDKCPYVIKYLDHFVVRSKISPEEYELTAFVFMELCNGGDLGDDIERSPGPYSRALTRRYFIELCKGMEFLHKREIAHFDFKPSNVLMQKEVNNPEVKHCKITDFGLSRIGYKPGRGVKKFKRYAGTRDFMAPEVLCCGLDNYKYVEYVAFKADIWSIGVTLYVMLTQEIFWDIPSNFTEIFYDRFIRDLKEKRFFSYEKFATRFKSYTLADLLIWMLKVDPKLRPTITDCLEHKWTKGGGEQDDMKNMKFMDEINELEKESRIYVTLKDKILEDKIQNMNIEKFSKIKTENLSKIKSQKFAQSKILSKAINK